MVWFVLPRRHLALFGISAVQDWECVRRVPAATHAHVYRRPATVAATAAAISPRITSTT